LALLYFSSGVIIAEMKLEKELPPDQEVPGVPDLLRTHLSRKLRGPCKRIKIEVAAPGNTFLVLNAIKLAERGAVNTSPDIDEAAALITAVMFSNHIECSGLDGYKGKYRITVEVRNDKGKTPLRELSFLIRYAPGDTDDGESELLRENAVLEEGLAMHREQMNTMVAQQSEMFEQFMEMSRMMVEPIRASVDMQMQATMMWTNGANLLVEGHKQIYSLESVALAEKAKSDRINALLLKFGGPLADISVKLMGTVLSKFGKAAARQADAADEPAAAQVVSTEAGDDGAIDVDIDENTLLAVMCDSFAASLTSKQRKLMHQNMTKSQLEALDMVFCAETNDDVAENWPKAEEKLSDKVMWFAGILTGEQQADFMKLRGIIQRYIEKLGATETP
jgi:hypothetical protein